MRIGLLVAQGMLIIIIASDHSGQKENFLIEIEILLAAQEIV